MWGPAKKQPPNVTFAECTSANVPPQRHFVQSSQQWNSQLRKRGWARWVRFLHIRISEGYTHTCSSQFTSSTFLSSAHRRKNTIQTGMLSAMGVLTFLRCCPPPAGRFQKVVMIWILQSITRMQSKCLWNTYTPQHICHQWIGALRPRVYFIQECTSLLSISVWTV